MIILLLLGALTVFQLALAGGAPLGRYAWGGQYEVLPVRLRVGSVVAIFIYACMAMLALSKLGYIELIFSEEFVNIGLWVATGCLAVGIVVNAISRSKPERYTMTPVALLLAVSFLIVTLG